MEYQIGAASAAQADNSTITFEYIPPRQACAPSPCGMLIVDDDELVRSRLSTLLKGYHYDIKLASSGAEALRVIEDSRIRIVLTDWQMPDMDGLALCRHVRSSAPDGYVYVLMLTVRTSKEDVLTGLAAGADDYVKKGAPIRELIARLEVARRITELDHALRIRAEQNRRFSFTDSLTGVHNLRYLVEHLPRELGRSQRYGHSLAVLSCKINEFKLIIDRFGRPASEGVLREFVARCQGCIRTASDWLARMGEDEFMIVLPETAALGATRVAHKLRKVLALEPVSTRAGPISMSASISMTAVEPKHELDSVARIRDMLRSASRRNSAPGSNVQDLPVDGRLDS
jgi:diguanylate cyclase (GGDEF)-like protein